MRFYSEHHAFTRGVDLHGRTLYFCVLDRAGQVVFRRNLPCKKEAVLGALAPFREDLVVSCECIFSWYWLADLCGDEGIDFSLGHALGMRLTHGTKTKNDKLDSEKIARLLHSGHFPLSYTYPRALRATRDLLRATRSQQGRRRPRQPTRAVRLGGGHPRTHFEVRPMAA